jgi:heptosyltransferase I
MNIRAACANTRLYAKMAFMPRILIVKTSSMGDVIHNLPVISDIHAHVPNAVIDWVVEESFQDIPAMHPGVTRVIPVAVRRWRKHLLRNKTWQEIGDVRRLLQKDRYDLIIDTQGLLKSAVISHLAEGKRHGYNHCSARERIAAFFYKHTHGVDRRLHAVIRNRALAAEALGYPPPITAPDYGIANGMQATPAFTGGQSYVVGLHATSRDSKLWPEANWIALGQALASQHMMLVLPWGNVTEEARAKRIAAQVPGSLVLPRLSLSTLAPILLGARAAIGVDTGLAHLTVALNIPTIAIYTDTDPTKTGLYPGAMARAENLGGRGADTPVSVVLMTLQSILPAG